MLGQHQASERPAFIPQCLGTVSHYHVRKSPIVLSSNVLFFTRSQLSNQLGHIGSQSGRTVGIKGRFPHHVYVLFRCNGSHSNHFNSCFLGCMQHHISPQGLLQIFHGARPLTLFVKNTVSTKANPRQRIQRRLPFLLVPPHDGTIVGHGLPSAHRSLATTGAVNPTFRFLLHKFGRVYKGSPPRHSP